MVPVTKEGALTRFEADASLPDGRRGGPLKRENVPFLLGGLVFGILLGLGLYHGIATRPGDVAPTEIADVPSPAGPPAPNQLGATTGAPADAQGSAPMLEEIRRLKETVEADPRNVDAWRRLGNLFQDVRMYPQAIEFYRKAIDLAPGNPDVLTDLGICYQGTGDYARALELFRDASAADPRHWQSVYNTVVVNAFNLRRFDDAEAALRRLEQVNPEAPGLAQLREAVGQARAGRS